MKATVLVATLLVACQSSTEEEPVVRGGQSCFAALELYCRVGRDMAPHLRLDASDPDLGLCLPFLDGSVRLPFAPRDVETTFHYDEQGRLVDLASECGQGETIHTRAEVGEGGRIEGWLIDLDLIQEEVEYKDYISAVRRLSYADDGTLSGDYNETTYLGGEEPETYAHTRTIDLGPPYARTTSTTGLLGYSWYGERGRGFVQSDDGASETLFEVTVRRPDGSVSEFRRVDYTYDEQGQLVSIADVTPYETVDDAIITAEYEWEDGRLVSATVTDSPARCSYEGPALHHRSTYAYEGSTVTVRTDGCVSSLDMTQTWELDADGRVVRFRLERGYEAVGR